MKNPIYFHETDMFKEWMKKKGYSWPAHPIAQENMMGEFMKEELETKGFCEKR